MHRPRSFRARRPRSTPWPAALALLVPAAAQGAAFLPGSDPPDPPTGEAPAPAPPPEPAGSGIRFEFGPWRSGGSLTLDLRRLHFEDGRQATQQVVSTDLEVANYVFQPWFVQFRAGVGLLLVNERASGADAPPDDDRSTALTGRLQLVVFPASRFPFEFRADASDTRASGDTLGSDYRSLRVGASQSWRPEVGNQSVSVNVDHSRLTARDGSTDTLNLLAASAVTQFTDHAVELGAQWSENQRDDTGDRSRLSLLSARHGFRPANELRVETLATWNDVRLRAAGNEAGSEVRQLSSVLSWRPHEGEPLYVADQPLVLGASARWVDSRAVGADEASAVRAVNATLGATQELSRSWRATASVAGGRVQGPSFAATSANASGSLSWTSPSVEVMGWRWTPTASANGGLARSSGEPTRKLVGVQAGHSLARDVLLGEGEGLALSFSQSAAALRESASSADSRALVHSASLYWQDAGDGQRQSFVGLSMSDSRNWSQDDGRFQLVNLQWSQRLAFSRFSSGSANITLQGSRSDSTQLDAFTGQTREQSSGWQRFYSVGINFEQQRAFGVPRLRYTLAANANSQQLERRSLGDIDAPRERITASIENRLDYAVGRLETRLAARAARVDGRTVASIILRAQRRF